MAWRAHAVPALRQEIIDSGAGRKYRTQVLFSSFGQKLMKNKDVRIFWVFIFFKSNDPNPYVTHTRTPHMQSDWELKCLELSRILKCRIKKS